MAGIFGIIDKKNDKKFDIAEMVELMAEKMCVSSEQKKSIFLNKNFAFGNVTLINDNTNKNYICNPKLQIYCVVDGLLFVNSDTKKKISEKYHLESNINDNDLLPWIYDYYKNEITQHLTGTYNVFIYNQKDNDSCLFNDRLGYLPLFLYFIF